MVRLEARCLQTVLWAKVKPGQVLSVKSKVIWWRLPAEGNQGLEYSDVIGPETDLRAESTIRL